jgi:hypothetical protein
VEEDPENGGKRTVQNRRGTPQGGVISPLLANLYLDGLDKAVNTGKQLKAVMVRYADDFVVLCRKGKGAEMNRRLRQWLERRKLKLNEEKTRIVDFETEGLEFLGFRLSWRKSRSGKQYPHCEPSAKNCQKLRDAIRKETTRATLWKEPWEVVARINERVHGWIGYHHYGNSGRVFSKLQWQVTNRVRRWLWKKHGKTQALFGPAYHDDRLHRHYGLVKFPIREVWK